MSQPDNSALSLSAIDYPLPKWRYFVLFQSWSQLQSYLIIVVTCALVIHGLALASHGRVMPPAALSAGLFAAGLISVVLVLKARFTVSPASEAAVRRVITEVECARYVEVGAQGNTIVYRQNLPRVLRWDEGNITVAREGDQLILTGPVAALKRVRKHLAN